MTEAILSRRDLISDQEVRWCPGCGDYAILKGVQSALAELGIPKEKMAIVSGIGCAARFPYYMDTYGMHSIHGRAPAVATGLKMANPDMHVWVVGGDGDMLSIGGNHLIHAIRRNIDLTILLFNNRIYGLTKGQFSPTSGLNIITKSSPMGSIDNAFDPVRLALGAGATFVGRTVDLWGKHLEEMVKAAHAHKGTSVVEILQNCNIFNDGAFEASIGRANKQEHSVELVHGQPLLFGKGNDKALRLNGFALEVVDANAADPSTLLIHDAEAENPGLAQMLANMNPPNMPTPTGIFRRVERPTYEVGMDEQVTRAQARTGGAKPSLQKLFEGGDTWTVP